MFGHRKTDPLKYTFCSFYKSEASRLFIIHIRYWQLLASTASILCCYMVKLSPFSKWHTHTHTGLGHTKSHPLIYIFFPCEKRIWCWRSLYPLIYCAVIVKSFIKREVSAKQSNLSRNRHTHTHTHIFYDIFFYYLSRKLYFLYFYVRITFHQDVQSTKFFCFFKYI